MSTAWVRVAKLALVVVTMWVIMLGAWASPASAAFDREASFRIALSKWIDARVAVWKNPRKCSACEGTRVGTYAGKLARYQNKFGERTWLAVAGASISRSILERVVWKNLEPKEQRGLLAWDKPQHAGHQLLAPERIVKAAND